MRIARTSILIVVCSAVAANCLAQASGAAANAGCPLADVKLDTDMPRLEAERRISAALGTAITYSPYANNLSGETKRYESGNCALAVTYAAGAPAPMVSAPGGSIHHMPPKDEIVAKFELVKKAPVLTAPADHGT